MEKKSLADRIFGLDLMLTIAILMVLFRHSLSIYPTNQSLIYQIGIFFGFFGVEIFFVLIGFLVGNYLYKIYLDEAFSFTSVFKFFKKYGLRFFSIYYLVLILNLIISFLIGYAVLDWWKYFVFLQNFNWPMLPFFTESWPLPVLLFGFLLLFSVLFIKTMMTKQYDKTQYFFIVVVCLTLFFVLTRVYYAFTTQNTTLDQWNLGLKSVVIYRLDAIYIGVLASFLSLKFTAFWRNMSFPFAIFGLLLFGFLFVGVGYFQFTIDKFPHFWNIFYLPLTSFTCVLFLPLLSQWKSTQFAFFHKLLSYISTISFAIYMLHYGVILQLMKYLIPLNAVSTNQLHLYSVCYYLLTVLLATLVCKFFIEPVFKRFDK